MAAVFDVYVVGPVQAAAEPTALATALAGRLGVARPVVAQGLADRKLCAGRRLEAGAAQTLVRELRELGATTMMRPSVAAGPADTPARPAPVPTGASRQPAPSGRPASDPHSSRPPSADSHDQFGPPPSGDFGRASGAADPFAPPPPKNKGPALPAPAADRFGAPASSPSMSLEIGGSSPPAPPARAAAHADPEDDEPSLELDIGPRTSSDELRKSPSTVAGASALNISMAGGSSDSGLAVDSQAAAAAHRLRCPKHGLFFDTRRASGCPRCLEPGRKMSVALAEQARGFKLLDFESAVKRAFIGLAIALVMGFIPAAYHALGVASREMRRLRAEQAALSQRPATEEILRRFAEIDATVGHTRNRYTRSTALLWVVVTGGALIGWYRLT
jgi:hypothetical protein